MLRAMDRLLEVDLRRAKEYFESRESISVVKGQLMVLRLDGVSFRTRLNGFRKPRDERVMAAIETAARELMRGFGAAVAYVVSDEINLFLGEHVPFGSREFKLTSVSAGIASAHVSIALGRPLYFDSRIVRLDHGDELPYIVWRARLAAGNYLSNFARKPFKEAIYMDGINYLDCCGKVLARKWIGNKPSRRVIMEYPAIDVIEMWRIPSSTDGYGEKRRGTT
ncbi:hypothetical protein GCM10007981_18340 [Thermocladium modestius]|uniref:tRNAHis guanylyltransferase catalytic domain-containing protein n=2 Tax=Thermocladium modestius TaxID=62609 RepID=A0A830GXC7_9CREN|nr:hypothetical protein GCM10007981_18340 [Thermocladium modestius]